VHNRSSTSSIYCGISYRDIVRYLLIRWQWSSEEDGGCTSIKPRSH